MATITMTTHLGFTTTTDKKWTPIPDPAGINTADFAVLGSVADIDAALAAANATYWTAARLDQTNVWDKLYWLRATRDSTIELT